MQIVFEGYNVDLAITKIRKHPVSVIKADDLTEEELQKIITQAKSLLKEN